jgi:transcription antitermination factor NusG
MNKIAVEGENRKEKCSLVNGTNDREAYPKRWIAVLVQVNCEKKTATRLGKVGYETYIPTQQEIHQWSDRKKKIDRVVIPMVIFVRLAQDEEDDFRRLSFILKFITYPGSKELATPIPDEQIEKLKFLLHNADAKVSIVENLKVGDKVRLVKGPMKGLEGELSHIEENKPIIAIRIDGLGYACVSVEKINLQLI